MKKLQVVLEVVLLAIVIALFSCNKTGPQGPQGEMGPCGEQGPAGPKGIAGADGTIIYSGKDLPAGDLGAIGDFYIDMTAGNLYGPKTDKGWGNPISLKGQKGQKGEKGEKGEKGATGKQGPKGDKGNPGQDGKDGKDGNQILSGTSVPTNSLGKAGDYYLNTSNFTLYGPKTTSGWGSGIGLRGPKGEKGDPGNANVISSGWIKTEYKWQNVKSGLGITFSEPGDLDVAEYLNHAYKINVQDAKDAAILVYVDNGNGIRPVPFRTTVEYISYPNFNDVTNELEFRYVIAKEQSTTDQYYHVVPVIALKKGSWDIKIGGPYFQVGIQGLYLTRLKWKIIVVPANVIARKSSSPPSSKDYRAICEYYGIPE